MSVPVFTFNPLDERMRQEQYRAAAETCRLLGWADADDLLGPGRPPLATEESLRAGMSDGAFAALLDGTLPPPADPAAARAFAADVRRRALDCMAELGGVKRRFYPGGRVTDRWPDGNPAYAAAVDAVVARHFPPRIRLSRCVARLAAYYDGPLFFVANGLASDADLRELSHRLAWAGFWADALKVPGAPPAPPADAPVAVARAYLRQVLDAGRRYLDYALRVTAPRPPAAPARPARPTRASREAAPVPATARTRAQLERDARVVLDAALDAVMAGRGAAMPTARQLAGMIGCGRTTAAALAREWRAAARKRGRPSPAPPPPPTVTDDVDTLDAPAGVTRPARRRTRSKRPNG
jgi:hypothetical protein